MSPVLSENRPIIAIGDVHGCLFSLKRLIEKINPQHDEQFVFLGDFIDRGAHSREVLDYLIKLGSLYSCHYIMGNHELMYLQYLEKSMPLRWPETGEKKTKKSRNISNDHNFSEKHLAFLSSCRFFIETDNYFFAHGGLDPELSISDNLRYYKPEEFCWQQVHMHTSFRESQNYNWEKTLVCAHTPVPVPVMTDRLIAIDTGCVYKQNPKLGMLTAVILPDRIIVQTENCD
ncbi:MAG: serine/threonine protein phosphatase [Chlorobiaceae bacterium]|jgi:serine/threonine protein phosphatase 1|nr:serine/threonine protein phosphatase [Chlorobiaceae bacterium]NTV17185.1 serine/threonine protein phosphatase [Chlorobiaceae bacterium]